MKSNFFNKMLGIGPGGINCPCCTDYSTKRKNHKKLYSKRRRVREKRFFKKIIDKFSNNTN